MVRHSFCVLHIYFWWRGPFFGVVCLYILKFTAAVGVFTLAFFFDMSSALKLDSRLWKRLIVSRRSCLFWMKCKGCFLIKDSTRDQRVAALAHIANPFLISTSDKLPQNPQNLNTLRARVQYQYVPSPPADHCLRLEREKGSEVQIQTNVVDEVPPGPNDLHQMLAHQPL